MGTQWQYARSFQQGQELLSAINTLSIHRKLTDRGHPDMNRIEASEQARETLVAFFEKLDKIVQKIEDGHRKPVLGVDARMRHLAGNYVHAKHASGQPRSPFLEHPLPQMRQVFYSESPNDRREVLKVLAAFRQLLDEHIGIDVKSLLGDI